MIKRILLLTWLFVVSLGVFAEEKQQSYVAHQWENNTLTIRTLNGSYVINAVAPDILKIAFQNEELKSDKIFAPVLTTTLPSELTEANNHLILQTSLIKLRIDKANLDFSFEDDKQKTLASNFGFFMRGDTVGFQSTMKPNERIYGTGARALPLNRRGYRFQCYNQANYGYGMGKDFLNYSIPHIMSSEKYMMLFDNPARGWFDIGKTKKNRMEFGTLGGNTVCYFIAGNSYKKLVGRYTELTGRQPLIPIWALGNLQSRMGYRNQAEAEGIASKMQAAGYPLDALIIDLYWFGEELEDGKMGQLDWDKRNWPNPKKMIRNLRKKGVKTITVSEPFFTKKSKNYKFLDQNKLLATDTKGNTLNMPNFYFGDGALIDIFKPEARDWFWKQYEKQHKIGVAGWWCDLGEPEVHPDTMMHVAGSARELHGVYGHEYAKMLFEKTKENYPEERIFSLARAGFAGSQRVGLIPWSGDVGRSWSGLEAQTPVMLSTGISGLAYMHSDAGGFAMGKKTPELYKRWLQFAAFTPIFRPHSDPNAEPEPIFYSEEIQKVVKRYIELRYRMLPYNYTLAWEVTSKGMPMARPLYMEYENDEHLVDEMQSYMWGPSLLVAPIIKPAVTSKDVYLPEGVWFDFHTQERLQGGKLVNKKITNDDIPVFVKAGGFLPLAPLVKSTDDYSTQELEMHYYADKSVSQSSYQMYTDDGKLRGSWEKGLFQLTRFSVKNSSKQLKVDISNSIGVYEDMPHRREITMVVHNISGRPKQVLSEGNELKFYWNEQNKQLSFKLILGQKQNATVLF